MISARKVLGISSERLVFSYIRRALSVVDTNIRSSSCEIDNIMENEKAEEIQRRKLISNYWDIHDDSQVDTDVAAMLLGRQPTTLKKWRSLGVGPSYMRGRPVMYRIGSLRDYIEEMQSRRMTPNSALGVARC